MENHYLYLCIMDLQKAYDFIDRELFWQILARCGVPSVMIAVIRQFHDGMSVGVRSETCVQNGLAWSRSYAKSVFSLLSTTFQHLLRCHASCHPAALQYRRRSTDELGAPRGFQGYGEARGITGKTSLGAADYAALPPVQSKVLQKSWPSLLRCAARSC